ncbi:E2 ubiquitin-conjugating enzyme [Ranunculus cassubicifolius]
MKKKLGISRKLSLGLSTTKSKWEDDDNGNKENINPNYQLKSEKEEEVVMSDATIVLDSEDSDEEVKVSRRSRLSIARKPLAGKRKAKA